MAIQFDAERNIFKLDSNTASYVFRIGPHGFLIHLYFGSPIPDTDLAYLSYTCRHTTQAPCFDEDNEEIAHLFGAV